MTPPIIIAAFGTTTRARDLYRQVDARLKTRFPDHEIHWAFTSRIVRHQLKQGGVTTATPAQMVAQLAGQGHVWAVVQSLTMICGHEFHRLVQEVRHDRCRTSIGHGLLCSQEDHEAVARVLAPLFDQDFDEAVVLVGHGTDHCTWSVYPAFYQRLREQYGKRVFGSMIEEPYPRMERLVEEVQLMGFRRVRLVPLMLVAGVHFEEDLGGARDSWKTAFEARGLEVVLEKQGLGSHDAIIDIFGDHIQSALSVIPGAASGRIPAPARTQVVARDEGRKTPWPH